MNNIGFYNNWGHGFNKFGMHVNYELSTNSWTQKTGFTICNSGWFRFHVQYPIPELFQDLARDKKGNP